MRAVAYLNALTLLLLGLLTAYLSLFVFGEGGHRAGTAFAFIILLAIDNAVHAKKIEWYIIIRPSSRYFVRLFSPITAIFLAAFIFAKTSINNGDVLPESPAQIRDHDIKMRWNVYLLISSISFQLLAITVMFGITRKAIASYSETNRASSKR